MSPLRIVLVLDPLAARADGGGQWSAVLRYLHAFGHASPGDIRVHAPGNSLTASGQIPGLVRDGSTRGERDHGDERFAVAVAARAVTAR